MTVKEFEKKQLDWWCNHYRNNLRDLSIRTRQYLNGEVQQGVLEAHLDAIEGQLKERENLV